MKPILDIQNLTMNYGALTAVDDVSFNLYPGQFMGLIGPNGSGKTSLLKCIAGAQIPTGGDILLEHIDVTRMTPAERFKSRVVTQISDNERLPEPDCIRQSSCRAASRRRAIRPAPFKNCRTFERYGQSAAGAVFHC